MSDPNTNSTTNSTTTTNSPEPGGDWREQRRAEKRARREAWRQGGRPMRGFGFPVGGLVILVIGAVFLLKNFGYDVPAHWWAALLLIPAVAALVSAIRFYRIDGAQSPRVVGPAIAGIVLLALALAIFFGLNWGLFWPLVLIVVGIAAISRYYWRRNG